MKAYVWKGETITIKPFKLDSSKKGLNPLLGRKRLTAEQWATLEPKIKPHIVQKTRFDLYEEDDGTLHYLNIVKPDENKNDLLDDDLQRSFEQGVRNTQELTRSKWAKLVKIGVVFLSIIFSVGAFLLFMVMLNKGQTEFAGKFAGIAQKGLNVTKVFGA